MLLKQKHVFSWRGSLEAALLEWRAGAVEVMAVQVQASPGFWQGLEFSLFRGGGGRESWWIVVSSLLLPTLLSSSLCQPWVLMAAARRRSNPETCGVL